MKVQNKHKQKNETIKDIMKHIELVIKKQKNAI